MTRILLLISSILLLVTGCTIAPNDDNQAIQVGESFKKLQYEVTDYKNIDRLKTPQEINKKVQPYLVEEEFDDFLSNSVALRTVDTAIKQKANIQVEKIKFDKQSEDKEKKTISFHYSLTIKATYPETKQNKVIIKNGQMTLIKNNDAWKVERDWDGYLNTEKDFN